MVLKFFDVVLKFELLRARCLNFPKNSVSVLIRLVLIIGDCVVFVNDLFWKKAHINKGLVHAWKKK